MSCSLGRCTLFFGEFTGSVPIGFEVVHAAVAYFFHPYSMCHGETANLSLSESVFLHEVET